MIEEVWFSYWERVKGKEMSASSCFFVIPDLKRSSILLVLNARMPKVELSCRDNYIEPTAVCPSQPLDRRTRSGLWYSLKNYSSIVSVSFLTMFSLKTELMVSTIADIHFKMTQTSWRCNQGTQHGIEYLIRLLSNSPLTSVFSVNQELIVWSDYIKYQMKLNWDNIIHCHILGPG